MGGYLNPGNEKFGEALNSQIYVDKTGLIEYTNRVMYSNQKYVCVSRPRRFGKSMAANMLAAYYSRGCDSRELFQGLKISIFSIISPLNLFIICYSKNQPSFVKTPYICLIPQSRKISSNIIK